VPLPRTREGGGARLRNLLPALYRVGNDGNGAVTFGGNGGVQYRLNDRVSLDARLGLRYMSGLSDAGGPLVTGLDDVNDGSSRWTLPLTVGAKFRF
jgi:hypothetical protein